MLMVEKNMLKDKWSIPVPAEYSQYIGLEKGGKVFIDLDKSSNRIIITKDEKVSEVKQEQPLEEKVYTPNEIADLIKFILNEDYSIKQQILDMLLSRAGTQMVSDNPKCGHCGRPLKPQEKLRINGKRICSNCKKIEVQKFLLYLERRKLDEERRKEEKEY